MNQYCFQKSRNAFLLCLGKTHHFLVKEGDGLFYALNFHIYALNFHIYALYFQSLNFNFCYYLPLYPHFVHRKLAYIRFITYLCHIFIYNILKSIEMGNKSNTEKEYDRRTILATYLYDVSKLSKFFAENSNKKINYYGIIDFCFCNLCYCRMGSGNFPSYGTREKMG